jgi:hypothetical protein
VNFTINDAVGLFCYVGMALVVSIFLFHIIVMDGTITLDRLWKRWLFVLCVLCWPLLLTGLIIYLLATLSGCAFIWLTGLDLRRIQTCVG